MMAGIRQYVISICAAAIVSGMVKSLTEKTDATAKVIQTFCGVFLIITAISPLFTIQIKDISEISLPYQEDAQDIAALAEHDANTARNEIIISCTEAYILDKAAALDARIHVEVLLSEEIPGLPCSVIIEGNVSPYAKTRLEEILESDLGIGREAQQWINNR